MTNIPQFPYQWELYTIQTKRQEFRRCLLLRVERTAGGMIETLVISPSVQSWESQDRFRGWTQQIEFIPWHTVEEIKLESIGAESDLFNQDNPSGVIFRDKKNHGYIALMRLWKAIEDRARHPYLVFRRTNDEELNDAALR